MFISKFNHWLTKKSIFIFTIILLTFALIFNYSTSSSASDVYQMKLNLNSDQLQKISNEMFVKENGTHFGENIKNATGDNSFVNLTFKVVPISNDPNHVTLEGNGVVNILNDTFPISYKDVVRKAEMPNGDTLYIGPISGDIKSKKGQSEIILGLEYIPATNQANVTLSIEDLGKGMGLVIFGEPFMTEEIWNNILKVENGE